MPLLLSEALESDFDSIIRCQFAAFWPHEHSHSIIWPGSPTPETLEKYRVRHLHLLAADSHATFLKINDSDTGEIVAGAKWCIYKQGIERPKRINVDWYGEDGSEDRAYCQFVMDEFHGRRVERMTGPHCCRCHDFTFSSLSGTVFHSSLMPLFVIDSTNPDLADLLVYIVLDLLFCIPTYQHRGAGTQLVQWGVQRADKMGIQAFVEATRAGRHLYEQNGFTSMESVQLGATRWPDKPLVEYFSMHRPARGASDVQHSVTERVPDGYKKLSDVV
ncbi:hypothetical protein MMC12_003675 [Toensbergia leucococca]|nr:hypothetical protein [Toensbergia leucococca]